MRPETVEPGPQSLSVHPILVEPDGSSWYKIAEILDHNGSAGPRCRCLVRWEGFDATHDSWILRKNITLTSILSYEKILTEMDTAGMQTHKHNLESFVGYKGQYSAILLSIKDSILVS